MKGHISIFILFFAVLGKISSQSETTIILQPGETGKDALIESRLSDQNFGDHPDFAAMAWTNGGVPVDVRSLIEFDLSSIPASATILTAELSLYSYNSPIHGSHSQLSGSNESVLRRITSSWDENTVTWETQPETTSENEIFLPPGTLGSSANYLNINVLELILDAINETSENFGLQYKLVNESYYRQMIFASGDNNNPALHPKLEISYRLEENCLELRPDAANGKDALLDSRLNNQNFGDHPDFAAMAWTNGGIPVDVRSLIEFDLSSIPASATILSAELSLYSYNSPYNGSHWPLSGSNESVLRRITSEWDENTVTWANQPSSTIENRVFLEESSAFPAPDYTAIDVTDLVQDMIESPTGNHGFLYKLVNENYYRQMIFASSDNPDPSLHPKLEVCFSSPVSTTDEMGMNSLTFQVYPNPTREFIKLDYTDKPGAETYFQIISPFGQIHLELKNIRPGAEINISNLAKGMYFISLFQNGEKVTRKILLQ